MLHLGEVRPCSRKLAIACLIVLTHAAWCFAQDSATPASESAAAAAAPTCVPVIKVVYVDAPPKLDGQLDDPCWASATRLEGFYCPEWDSPAPEETTALICADDRAIYAAVTCKDRTPDDIVAAESRRNGDLWNDDHFRVWLDTNHQHKDAYLFLVNACGTQCDDVPGGSASKIEWRGDWQAAASRTNDGWQAEMAIPFSILRYPPGQTTFGLALTRYFGQERVAGLWPRLGKTWDYNLSADLTGLHPPAPVARPVYMPYVTVDMGEAADRGIDAGLDVQYKLPNGLTALGVLNPDYKQIEDVVEPISFSYTERYLSDPRPFFVTGQSGFLPREHLFCTRRITDFDAGIKLFGTVGDETIGLLDAITFGQENSLAAAWNHRFGENDNAKLLLVSHEAEGEPSDLSLGLDACHVWRQPNGSDSLWTVLYQSRSEDRGTGSSYAIGGAHDRGPGAINFDWMLRRTTPDFAPALGYFPDTDNVGGTLNISRTDLYDKGPLFGKQWVLTFDYYPYLESDGIYLSRFQPAYAWLTKGGQLYVVQLVRSIDHGYDTSGVALIHAWHDADKHRRGEVTLVQGTAGGGDYTYYKLDQGLRPMGRVSLRLMGEHTRLVFPDGTDETNYQAVLTALYDITCERSVAARAIWRSGRFSAYAAYRQVVRRGMDAYIILGDPDPELTGFTHRVVFKLIWAF